MASNTIFISYSRKDSEYMAEFSKNLRNAGANLWSDKQILPGGLWDNSIETALESCDVIIVLISKASINSNNVMDEVSFALEENKKVIPILLEECDLPFRLRRIQFIDFTKNQENGMNLLKSTLNLNTTPVSNLSYKVDEVKEKSGSKIVEKSSSNKIVEEIPKKESPPPKIPEVKSKIKVIYFIIPIILLVGAYFIYTNFIDNKKPINPVDQPIIKDTIVNNKLDETIETDDSEWEIIKNSNLISDYETHLSTYENCIHVQEANNIINDLKIILEEDNKYNTANTSLELLNYIMEYGKSGTYYKEALNNLDNYFTSNGFVQFSASNGELYFNIFEKETRKIPEIGDLIFAKGQRNLHKGPLNSSNYSIITHTTSKDEVFKVKEVNRTGDAYWVKVAH